MKRLAILGASGHGKVIADAALLSGWDEIQFFDDAWPQKTLNGCWPIVGDTQVLQEGGHQYSGVIVGIGHNLIRLIKTKQLFDAGLPMVSIVHPRAIISPFVSLGYGSVVMAGAVVHVGTRMGIACIVNTSASVDHDCNLADGVHICPGSSLAGGVCVGETSWIGIGSCIKQLIKVGINVTVGAGTVVVADIADSLTVVGVPARVLNREGKC